MHGSGSIPHKRLLGLSPRVRGNLSSTGQGQPCARSIPARTGEPTKHRTVNPPLPVYPRAYGGTDVVWSDVSRFLTDPDELTDELLADDSDAENHAIAEAERDSLLANRSAVQDRRTRAIDLYTRGKVSEVEFDAIAADVERELKTLDDRLADLEPEDGDLDDAASEDVLAEIRERLDDDLSDSERREIVRLLVRRITVHTTLPDRGRKQVRVVIDYRFPPGGAARTGTPASVNYTLRRVLALAA